jgi:uncharacterized protein YndB with AHSA1/START domain
MPAGEDPQSIATRRHVILGLTAGAAVLGTPRAQAAAKEVARAKEVAHTMESIHQEIIFKAPRERVYTALTDAAEFQKVVLLSGAAQSGMIKTTQAAQISREAGGAFSIFGGYVSGRQIELVPNTRIVQAWRPQEWEPGVYSIARFELVKEGAGTRLVFDHTGFPKGDGEHLSEGWHQNYWEPLAKVLS